MTAHETLKKQHSEASEEVKKWTSETERHLSSIQSLQKDASSAHQRADTIEKRVSALQAENERLVSTLDEVNAKVGTLTQEKASLEEAREALTRQANP